MRINYADNRTLVVLRRELRPRTIPKERGSKERTKDRCQTGARPNE